MIKNGKGGANTITGAIFENETDIIKFLATKVEGYSIVEHQEYIEIFFDKKQVAKSFRKHQLYKFLKLEGLKSLSH